VDFTLEGDPLQLPPVNSPAAGYGFTPAKGSQGPLRPSQVGPEWR
jgi:hypothetical protein